MKKYSEISEQDVIQAITDKIGRDVEVVFTPTILDPMHFVPKKTLRIKYKDKNFRIKASFKVKQAQDSFSDDSIEERFSNFIDEAVADFERQIAEDEESK